MDVMSEYDALLEACAERDELKKENQRLREVAFKHLKERERLEALILNGETKVVLEEEITSLRKFVASLGAKDVPCSCGSGGHPRRCDRHPWEYEKHIMEIDLGTMNERVEEIEAECAELREALEWTVEVDPDLYGNEDPEKGVPLTPVARALSSDAGRDNLAVVEAARALIKASVLTQDLWDDLRDALERNPSY